MAAAPAQQTAQSSVLKPEDADKQIKDDPYLEPFKDQLRYRMEHYLRSKQAIEKNHGSLASFAEGYKYFGFNRVQGGIMYREWAPNAKEAWLIDGWNRNVTYLTRDNFGVWSVMLPDKADGTPAIPHNSKIKLALKISDHEWVDRIPAWIRRVVQENQHPFAWDAIYWMPPAYQWKHARPTRPTDLRIYEAHVGMGSEHPKVASYDDFRKDVLPHVKSTGYNAIQLMGVMEHAYYASFGYQVTNFFAVSSRCGTPEELKAMIDEAHGMGISVLLDVVHSHASKNVLEGLNQFDGTDHGYFHGGAGGNHPIWDSRLFNYGLYEVQRFLLSNLRFYLEEYRFDGFRFDGVTSMVYKHHGVAHAFTNGYSEYFGDNVDQDAVSYLYMGNDMLHSVLPGVITIAEEVSGMVGMCRPIMEGANELTDMSVGGIGFDYRLGMGIPDMWIEILKTKRDEDWPMGHICHILSDRRYKEATIAYCESHDQALVGDKTIAFWLMDKEMYTHMSDISPANDDGAAAVSRGIALHKLIRLVTYALGGEGYLTFFGNEFGHPEWIDFPRAGNNNSYHYARRRWDLARDQTLKYRHMLRFEKAMHLLEEAFHWLPTGQAFISCKHDGDKIIAFDRAGLVFVFNFHPSKSFEGYRVAVPDAGEYKIVLDSDRGEYGGHDILCKDGQKLAHDSYTFTFKAEGTPHNGRNYSLQLYIPSRTALVLAPVSRMPHNTAHLPVSLSVHHPSSGHLAHHS